MRRREAAPADFLGSHGSIRPFQGSPWDGRHFCAEDWHVILVGWVDGGAASFDHQQARAAFDPVTITLHARRRPAGNDPDPDQALQRPGAVRGGNGRGTSNRAGSWRRMTSSVGQHELSVSVTDPTGVADNGITFFVDAAGTGACMQE